MKIDLHTIIPPELHGMRLDLALARLLPEHSRGRIQGWIRNGEVLLDGKTCAPKDAVSENQIIEIHAKVLGEERWKPEDIAINIVFEDDDIIIINKTADMVVHPAIGNRSGTLVNALLHHDAELAKIPRAGIIHRLDKDTSGLMIVARSLEAHTSLVTQMQARTIKRQYQAIVLGEIIAGNTVDAPLGRHPTKRTKMAVVNDGKSAITHYRVLERFRAHTHLQLQLETGRTHQIRVHMAHIHHPIVGDKSYGGRLKLPANVSDELRDTLQHFPRQALHACELAIIHPKTGEEISWKADAPDDIQQLLTLLREDACSTS